MKTNKSLLLITVLFIFGIKTVLACECRTSTVVLFQTRAEVFSGKVISEEYKKITEADDKDFGLEVLFVKIKTDRWWRGSGDSEVEMRTYRARVNGGTRMTDCDYFIKEKESYLVFANFYNGWFKTNNCSGTKELSKAEEDLKALGEGFQPVEPVSILETNSEILGSYPVFFR